MTISSLLPIGSAALGVVASQAIKGLSAGLSFRDFMSEAPASGSNSPTIVSDPPGDPETQLSEFTQQLVEQLKAQGIDLSQPFALKLDGHGDIVLDGDHPDRSAIEEILSQNTKLSEEFRQLAEAASEAQVAAGSAGGSFGEFRFHMADGAAAIEFE